MLEPVAPANGQPTFDFTGLDVWVGALAGHGLRWQAVLLGTPGPEWALDRRAAESGCGSNSPPSTPGPFAEMASAVAARYGEGGSFWDERPDLDPLPVTDYEIWNEPNLAGFWCPNPDPGAYGDLVVETAASIRAADRDARIVLGGLSTVPELTTEAGAATRIPADAFLAEAVAAEPDLPGAVDVAAVHSYGPAASDVLSDVASFRATLDDLGMGDVPIALNEVGWPTQGTNAFPPVSDEERADLLTETTAAVMESGCGVVAFAPHTWTTAQADPADAEDWYGLADPATGEPYDSAGAYLDAAADLRETGEPGESCP